MLTPQERMPLQFYVIGAVEYFSNKTKDSIRRTAFEIALTYNETNQIHFRNKSKHKLLTIPNKEFTGLQLLAYYYVALAETEPQLLKVLPFSLEKEYKLAKQTFGKN